MKTKRRIGKLNDPDLDIPPLTDEQLRSMRRAAPDETEKYRRAIESPLGIARPRRGGRKLHPRALAWARAEAKRRGIGYQTIINETLLNHAV
jgi:hypothetical protein